MASKKIQEINAGSMADIAFLLLIFFLVATTMNVDTGIQRMLPPISKDETGMDIKERNVLKVYINKANQVAVSGIPMDINFLKDKAKEYILNRANDPKMSEIEVKNIELIGNYPVSKGVISLQNDRATSYETYIHVQNELTRAFNEIRDELATLKFGKPYADLNTEQQEAVRKAVPQNISEAEPRNIGGK